jgi:hypothetical protein
MKQGRNYSGKHLFGKEKPFFTLKH